MGRFEHLRHQPPRALARPRELIVALPPMHSNVNLSRVVRAAGCLGIQHVVACGRPRLDPKIVRDALDSVRLERHRSLPPLLRGWRGEGYLLVALEQATGSECLFEFAFPRRCVLVAGHERTGVDEQTLGLVDRVVEIPVYGRPLSYNAATATMLAMYEYCRQYPDG